MAREKESRSCFAEIGSGIGCCKVESVVSVDDRGQMVLPKDLREKAKIRPGDKMAVIGWEKAGEVCCISLIKAEALTEGVRGLLGPMMQEMLSS